jgi:hypothetical protein
MKRLAFAALVLLTLSCKRTPVPLDTQLWRLETPWVDAGNSVRTAKAAILIFRSRNEFVELHTSVIERPDGTVYIMSRAPRTAAIGRWEQHGSKVEVHRTKGLCGTLNFRITGNSVSDNSGTYSPVTRLVAPEFETFVNRAKQSEVTCP